MKVHNFSAGPSILPKEVLQESAKSTLQLKNIGMSILEISHRSIDFLNIINEAKTLTKELLDIPNTHEVLFLQGGASLQFYMSALNFCGKHKCSGFLDTGIWAKKAINEAKKVSKTIKIGSSSDKNYSYIPKNISFNEDFDYIHLTSNNTIYGTQIHSFDFINKHIKTEKLICDMSSDIFSRRIDIKNFDLIYAGAQKNLGPAGTTLIIIKKDSLTNKEDRPTYLDYRTHINKESLFNTPPVFSIYVSLLTLRWINKNGGIINIEKKNIEKSNALYNEIDRNSLFFGLVEKDDRSIMNATFDLYDQNLKRKFEELCNKERISGINGHRTTGGFRASMYNALEKESVNKLIEVMQTLENKNKK
ncbi:MAG: 3-phosphoserine/phosphohydroxythreonine transaminase [Flavobacteriales bacterium]|nr:3-phosphoserine/phosphohydroxythreonine transaminase [Flavobacteriales bacterium]|tara:strand:+ start:4426 stop:5511 length:1086 start_codon:yes stop_codon:yes gene_type:complete